MTRQYGRSLAGQRLFDSVSGSQWNTTTMISAIRLEGVVTAMVTEGAMNALLFHGFVEKFLAPELRPGDIVVMDNLSSHNARGNRSSGCRGVVLASLFSRFQSDRIDVVQSQKPPTQFRRSHQADTNHCHRQGVKMRLPPKMPQAGSHMMGTEHANVKRSKQSDSTMCLGATHRQYRNPSYGNNCLGRGRQHPTADR